MSCDSPSAIYPMLVDIYYAGVSQGTYGNVKKQWMFSKSVPCYFAHAGLKNKEEFRTNTVALIQDTTLLGRTASDIRFSELGDSTSSNNVLLTNIRDSSGSPIYVEPAGERVGKSTLFEIASVAPTIGMFGKVEYYKIVLRRSDNQAVDL